METKSYLRSKTIIFLIIVLIIVIFNVLGLGEAQPGRTYDTISQLKGRMIEQIKNIILIIAVVGAGYGRAVAKKPLGRKKKNEK